MPTASLEKAMKVFRSPLQQFLSFTSELLRTVSPIFDKLNPVIEYIYFSIPIYSYFEVLRKRNNFISGVNSFCRSLHEVHRFPGYNNYHFFASQLGVDSRPLSSKNLKLEYLTYHMLFKILLFKKYQSIRHLDQFGID